jgi:uncharacterized protein (DUF3820 family)
MDKGPAMTFLQSRDFKMPFGKYRGKTLDEIASNDEGLRYLDWLYGETETEAGPVQDALRVYLADPTIAKDLRSLVG